MLVSPLESHKLPGLGHNRSSQWYNMCSLKEAVEGFSPSLLPSRLVISSQHQQLLTRTIISLVCLFAEGKTQSRLPRRVGQQQQHITAHLDCEGAGPTAGDMEATMTPGLGLALSISCWPQDRGIDKVAFPAPYFILASSIWPLLHHYSSDI